VSKEELEQPIDSKELGMNFTIPPYQKNPHKSSQSEKSSQILSIRKNPNNSSQSEKSSQILPIRKILKRAKSSQ